MTHGKTYNKSPRRINHKATKSKTNTGTTALDRSVEQTTFTASQLHPGSRYYSLSQQVKQNAKWAAVEGDQNASITKQLVKQKAKLAAIENGNHNASITKKKQQKKQKELQRVRTTPGPPP